MPCVPFAPPWHSVRGVHDSHILYVASGVCWCVKCGAYVGVRLVHLAQLCPGVPDTKAKHDAYNLFTKGICPTRLDGQMMYVGMSVPLTSTVVDHKLPLFDFEMAPAWAAFKIERAAFVGAADDPPAAAEGEGNGA